MFAVNVRVHISLRVFFPISLRREGKIDILFSCCDKCVARGAIIMIQNAIDYLYPLSVHVGIVYQSHWPFHSMIICNALPSNVRRIDSLLHTQLTHSAQRRRMRFCLVKIDIQKMVDWKMELWERELRSEEWRCPIIQFCVQILDLHKYSADIPTIFAKEFAVIEAFIIHIYAAVDWVMR